MRIGYLYDFEAYPPRGGNHVHAMELTQGFLRLGHSVSVVDDPTMPGVINFSSTPENLEQFVKNIDILYVRIDARFTRQWGVLVKCMNLAAALPVVWEINSPANETLAYSWLGGKSTLGGQTKENIVRILKRRLHASRKLPGIWMEERHRRYLARNVSHAICVSKSLARYASEDLGISEVLVLPNGGPLLSESDIQERRSRRQWTNFVVLYSGSAMYPWQGLDYLSEVIALANKKAPDILFALAVNQRTPNLPTSDNVIVLEHLDREKILDAICASDACVSLHPEYPWSKYNFHNSPMKLFEYMACMRPVVTSNHGQMRDIIRDGEDGILSTNDPEDILSKLLFVRDHPEQAADIARKGWERIRSEFSWQHNVENTLHIFDILLGK